MFVGLRPAANISTSNSNQYRDWHRLTLLTDNLIDVSSKSHAKVVIDDTVAWNQGATPNKTKTAFSQESAERYNFPSFTETIDNLQLQAHSINIYSQYKAQFFRDYASYTFGGTNLVTPEDPGAMMINFCLFPGTYQPSGHINVSRAREFYLQYVSSYVTSSTTADLLVLAIAINFLLISDGSAVLNRYLGTKRQSPRRGQMTRLVFPSTRMVNARFSNCGKLLRDFTTYLPCRKISS